MSKLQSIGIGVSDILGAQAFYQPVVRPLGMTVMMSIEAEPSRSNPRRVGFGSGGKPFVRLHHVSAPSQGAHIALIATSREAVDAFYVAGIAAGGQANWAPVIRPHYHSNYYAA